MKAKCTRCGEDKRLNVHGYCKECAKTQGKCARCIPRKMRPRERDQRDLRQWMILKESALAIADSASNFFDYISTNSSGKKVLVATTSKETKRTGRGMLKTARELKLRAKKFKKGAMRELDRLKGEKT